MSISLMHQVWRETSYSGTTLNVALILANWANDDGEIVYSRARVEDIAALAHVSPRRVTSALSTLRSDGRLDTAHRHGQASIYTLRLDDENVTPDPDEFVTPLTDQRTNSSNRGESPSAASEKDAVKREVQPVPKSSQLHQTARERAREERKKPRPSGEPRVSSEPRKRRSVSDAISELDQWKDGRS